MEDRNEIVEKGIKAAYRDKIPGGIQHVFCVGNKQYWEFRDRPKAEFLPWLRLSGILRLRMHCLSKVADSQLVLATKHVQESIPALLNAVELWVASGAGGRDAEEKKAIRETLDRVENDLITVSIIHDPEP
ncbi:hypothetical protein Sste5346_009483 [Sporothrix stenoceras]|uniref:Uncharacterized protein n=1 Tax=Sporothrix stenoceras TaxID=5173 RepID=A0ABR3YJY9_9PEZI